MKQEVIDKFNAVTDESVEDYCKARDGGFCWLWFMERIRGKAVASGFLPEQGSLVFEPRYIDSADAVLNGISDSMRSVESPSIAATQGEAWEQNEVEQWKQVAMGTSALMFDAGIVAALTRGYEADYDPLRVNAPAAIFGDVGFLGLRGKSINFLREIGGDAADELAGEIGDCACSHLYADQHITECVFKDTAEKREQYFRGVCKAAYVAGAVFAQMIAARGATAAARELR